MTNAQTINDADPLVMVACIRAVALRAIPSSKTAPTSVRRPVGCKVWVHTTPARVRIAPKASAAVRVALPRSP